MNRSPMRCVFAGLLAGVLALPGCFTADDAGEEAWVRSVVPAAIGRKVKNQAELAVLVELATVEGRGAVLDYLFTLDDYRTYWRQALTDALQADRTGVKAQAEGCWDGVGETLVDEGLSASLVSHIESAGYEVPFAWDDDGDTSTPDVDLAFTMSDVLYASIDQDSLDTAYRAWLFPYAVHGDNPTANEENFRLNVQTGMIDRFLGRNTDCMECHTSAFSRTQDLDGASWDRHVPLARDLEGSVFAIDTGTSGEYRWGGMATLNTASRLSPYFRTDQFGTVNSPGDGPWGMDLDCLTYANPGHTEGGFEGYVDLTGLSSATTQPAQFAGASQSYTVGVIDLVDRFAAGVAVLDGRFGSSPTGDLLAAGTPLVDLAGAAGDSTQVGPCTGCHSLGSSSPPGLDVIAANYSDAAVFEALLDPPGDMAAEVGTLDADDAAQVLADLAAWASANGHSRPADLPRVADGAEAYAWMVASELVDDIVHEVWGQRLTLEHGFSRNGDQQSVHEALTALFVGSGWSLQALLREMLVSAAFNRQAPDSSTDYQLPMLANPWAAGDPTDSSTDWSDPLVDANGQGDLVNRYSIPNLLLSVREAMGWGAVETYGTNEGTFPDETLMKEMGRYWSEENPGFDGLNLQALWRYEAMVGGSCTKLDIPTADAEAFGLLNDTYSSSSDPFGAGGPCVASTGAPGDYTDPSCWDDWIDLLDATADDLLSDGDATNDPTVGEVLATMRDRLLGSPEVDPTEQTLLETVYGSAFSDTPTSIDEDALRAICGVMVRSPQFMLKGLPDGTAVSTTPLEVCMKGETCNEEDLCDEVSAVMTGLGYSFACDAEVDLEVVAELAAAPVHTLTSLGWTYVLDFDVQVHNVGAWSTPPATLRGSPSSLGPDLVVPALAPGESSTSTWTVSVAATYSGALFGSKTVSWEVDPDLLLDDIDRSNNTATIDIDSDWWKPDYRIATLSSQWDASAGSVRLDWTVLNAGPVGVSPSTNSVLSATSGASSGSMQLIGGLASLQESSVRSTWVSGGVISRWTITADAADVIDESDETNNWAAITVLPAVTWSAGTLAELLDSGEFSPAPPPAAPPPPGTPPAQWPLQPPPPGPFVGWASYVYSEATDGAPSIAEFRDGLDTAMAAWDTEAPVPEDPWLMLPWHQVRIEPGFVTVGTRPAMPLLLPVAGGPPPQ